MPLNPWRLIAHFPPLTGTLVVDPEDRKDYLKHADVWWSDKEKDISKADMFNGPPNPYGLKTHQVIDCKFVQPDLTDPIGGTTPKFKCSYEYKDGKTVDLKIKYDQQYNPMLDWGHPNPEVYTSLVGQRVLWALGFASDQSVPLTVNCHGCPLEPWTYIQNIQGYDSEDVASGWINMDLTNSGEWNTTVPLLTFNSTIAYIKLDKYHDGDEIDYLDTDGNQQMGYFWQEMYDNPTSGEQQTARDALSVIAAFLNYCDNFDGNQGFICLDDPERIAKDNMCSGTPFIYIHDIGGSMGYGWSLKHKNFWPNYFDLPQWMEAEMWGDINTCQVSVNGIPGSSWSGNLPVTEEGRAMAARLLSKLTQQQLYDVFTSARSQMMRGESVTNWVNGFKKKMQDSMVSQVCPSSH